MSLVRNTPNLTMCQEIYFYMTIPGIVMEILPDIGNIGKFRYHLSDAILYLTKLRQRIRVHTAPNYMQPRNMCIMMRVCIWLCSIQYNSVK